MRHSLLAVVVCAAAAGVSSSTAPYPLDGFEYTGIRRLNAYSRILNRQMPGNLTLQPGARLPADSIRLRLAGVNEDYDVGPGTPRDSILQAGLERIVGRRHPSYRIALVDLTDPDAPLYAGLREDDGYIPGSVGKILVMTGLFNELARLHPDDVQARARVLRDTRVVADDWVIPNSHAIPVVADDYSSVTHRAVRVGDEFTLWEWVDHMISPSSNAAGSMVWKHAILLREFGPSYPPPVDTQKAFFATTPKPELSDRSTRVLEEPILRIGIDTAGLRLRTFFTRTAGRYVPGQSSYSTPRQLVRWLVRMEQGRVVDGWSSLEMKRLLYFTRRRYRYAASRSLDSAAVYFKSGSLYQCREEPGYNCGQYRGNAMNLMHSVAIVEAPASGERQRVYLLSMMSNVLKVNSAAEHAEIATLIDRLIASRHP